MTKRKLGHRHKGVDILGSLYTCDCRGRNVTSYLCIHDLCKTCVNICPVPCARLSVHILALVKQGDVVRTCALCQVKGIIKQFHTLFMAISTLPVLITRLRIDCKLSLVSRIIPTKAEAQGTYHRIEEGHVNYCQNAHATIFNNWAPGHSDIYFQHTSTNVISPEDLGKHA